MRVPTTVGRPSPGGPDVIVDTDVVGRDVPYAESFPTSYGDDLPTQHVFVRLRGERHVGYGEGSALQRFTGETTATMAHVVDDLLLPVVADRPVRAAMGRFREAAERLPGHPGAKAAVEGALLDLRAKQLGVPVADLLGTQRRTEVPLAFAIGARPAEDVVAEVVDAHERGFRTFKVKADGDLQDDVERVRAVVDALDERASPAAVDVRVDANTGWERSERALQVIERVDDRGFVEYYEQPVAADAVTDLRSLRRHAGVPVFADEPVHDTGDVAALLAPPPAVSGVCVKLAKTGSLRELVVMGELAAEANRPVTLVSAFESSLGMAANLHVAAVLPRLTSAAELGADLIAEDPVVDSIRTRPSVAVPDGPGLGVDLDADLFDDG